MEKIILYSFVLLTVCACATGGQISCTTIKIDSFEEKSNCSFFDDSFSDLHALQLEMGDYFFGEIKLFKKFDQGYVFVDWDNIVYIFDEDGTLLSRIDKNGRGPEEYISIDDIDVISSRDIVVLSGFENKLLRYSFDGRCITKVEIPWECNSFVCVEDKIIFDVSCSDDSQENKIIISDMSANVESSFLPMSYSEADYFVSSEIVKVSGTESFLYFQSHSGQLVNFSIDGSVNKEYEIDFKNKAFPKEMLSRSTEEIMSSIEFMDYIYIYKAFENDNYLLFSLINQNGLDSNVGAWWLYSKNSGKSRIEYYSVYDSDFYDALGTPLLLTDCDEVLFLCDADALHDSLDSVVLPKLDNRQGYFLLSFKISAF